MDGDGEQHFRVAHQRQRLKEVNTYRRRNENYQKAIECDADIFERMRQKWLQARPLHRILHAVGYKLETLEVDVSLAAM